MTLLFVAWLAAAGASDGGRVMIIEASWRAGRTDGRTDGERMNDYYFEYSLYAHERVLFVVASRLVDYVESQRICESACEAVFTWNGENDE